MNEDNKEPFGIEPEEFNGLTWGQLNAMSFPEDRWRVKNLIPKSGYVILAAISNEGKTWIALEMARSIAMGSNFLGQDQFKTIQSKVLYIDGENSLSELQRRGRQLDFCDNDQLFILSVDSLNLNSDEAVAVLYNWIEDQEFEVIFIDTFRAVSGGLKEEKAEEIRGFFNRFKPLKEKSISIIWLDHYRKPSNFEGKIPKKEFLFGSQDKTANIEVLLMMKKEENEISIYQRKNRLGKEIDPFKVKIEDQESIDNTDIKTIITFDGVINEKESKKDEAKEFIPGILAEAPKTTPEISQILFKEKKIADRNTREALRELVAEGRINKRKNGRKDEFFLPPNQQELEAEEIFSSL